MKMMDWTFFAPHPDTRDWPCDVVEVTAEKAGHWVKLGWKDFTAAWGFDLFYGGLFALGGWALYAGLQTTGQLIMILPLAIGFLLIAPVLAVAFYEVSRRIHDGEPRSMGAIFGAMGHRADRLGGPGVVLAIAFMVWLELSLILFSAFFSGQTVTLSMLWSAMIQTPAGIGFLVSWLAMAAFFMGLVFALTAVTVPLLHDRDDINLMTALGIGVNAVRVNAGTMLAWALAIAFLAFIGMGLFFIGLAIAFPVLGHATWHAYRDMVHWHDKA